MKEQTLRQIVREEIRRLDEVPGGAYEVRMEKSAGSGRLVRVGPRDFGWTPESGMAALTAGGNFAGRQSAEEFADWLADRNELRDVGVYDSRGDRVYTPTRY